MSEILEYIDAYFNKELNESEQKQFETRCTTDDDFARDVAFYVMARDEARQALLRQKQQWKNETTIVKPAKKSIVLRLMPYAAAACLVLVMAFYFLFAMNNSPRQLAKQYLQSSDTLSNTMDASRDSLQTGILEYKKKNYQQAALLFEGVKNSDSANSDVKKYAGLAYLHLNNYDKALQCFRELSAMKGLYSNPGDMLQASTLLERDATGDKDAAKPLLEKVAKENEDGSDMAKKILEKW